MLWRRSLRRLQGEKSGAWQKRPYNFSERETFGNLVDAQSREQRPLCRTGRRDFALDSQSQTVGHTVNCQGDDQRGSDFAEMSRGISVEMTGCTSRANMVDMFAD